MNLNGSSPQLNWIDQIRIRHLIREDLPALEWDGEYTHFRQLFGRTYQMARRGGAVLWVAISPSNKMVGQVFVQLNQNRAKKTTGQTHGYIFSFRVKSDFRSMGIGKRLLITAENDLLRRKFGRATLNVAKENERALTFYERNGFKIIGEEEGRWSYRDHKNKTRFVHEPSWRMAKNLVVPAV